MKKTAKTAALALLLLPAAALASQPYDAYLAELRKAGDGKVFVAVDGTPGEKPACATGKWDYVATNPVMVELLEKAAVRTQRITFRGDGTCTGTSENLADVTFYNML